MVMNHELCLHNAMLIQTHKNVTRSQKGSVLQCLEFAFEVMCESVDNIVALPIPPSGQFQKLGSCI